MGGAPTSRLSPHCGGVGTVPLGVRKQWHPFNTAGLAASGTHPRCATIGTFENAVGPVLLRSVPRERGAERNPPPTPCPSAGSMQLVPHARPVGKAQGAATPRRQARSDRSPDRPAAARYGAFRPVTASSPPAVAAAARMEGEAAGRSADAGRAGEGYELTGRCAPRPSARNRSESPVITGLAQRRCTRSSELTAGGIAPDSSARDNARESTASRRSRQVAFLGRKAPRTTSDRRRPMATRRETRNPRQPLRIRPVGPTSLGVSRETSRRNAVEGAAS